MEGWIALPITLAIIAASAVFVSIEFSSIAARRTRLEAAATSSRSARAAVRSVSEVSLLLAGCQLGITACTLALGAVTKPALEHALEPLLAAVGLPGGVVYVLSFALALLIATFLHLVVGEMAPKSWAIGHPERTATLFALPMRGFMWVFRPALLILNEAANGLVRRVGVEPRDEVAIEQNAGDLRQLVLHSAETGELDEDASRQLDSALQATQRTVGEAISTGQVVSVEPDATVGEAKQQARESGHMRILVGAAGQAPAGVVHVRDTLTSEPDIAISGFARELQRIDPDTTVLDALTMMRETGTQIALVRGPDQADDPQDEYAVVTVADLLALVMPAAARVEGVSSASPG